jgi:hypothetical protein
MGPQNWHAVSAARPGTSPESSATFFISLIAKLDEVGQKIQQTEEYLAQRTEELKQPRELWHEQEKLFTTEVYAPGARRPA